MKTLRSYVGGAWHEASADFTTLVNPSTEEPVARVSSNGVDFGAECGAPMYATANGEVIAQYYQTAWGNRLIIDHGWQRGTGLASIYHHATHYVVGVGQRVRRGQLVGYVGTTGWSTGCHLHFTVMANGSPVDPMNWF